MTMIRVPEYEVTTIVDYAYTCDHASCPAMSTTPLIARWRVVVPEGDYGKPRHYCPSHSADAMQGGAR